jgi:heme/copper-type cytochrome/quinol oxidase subunit 2
MDHGYMPIVVEVVEPAAFQVWLDSEKGDVMPMTDNGETP